jgi:Leucine-rich repeat (LRR) protein
LELEDNWFTGPPHFLGNMSSLVYVYLSRNSLFGHLNFLKTGKLTNLLEIWLDHNTIQSTLPTEIAQLTSLQSFSCVNTSLTGTIPSELGALPKLNRIWLHDNKIKGTVPTELAKLKKLEVLDVHHNELGGTMPSGVCSAINASTYAKKALQADCKEVNCTCCTKCY